MVIAADLVPAALGVLTRGTALAAAVLSLTIAWLLGRRGAGAMARTTPGRDSPPPVALGSPLSVATAGASALVLGSYVAARLRVLIGQPVTNIDLLGFHLPGVARFIQTGSVWHVDQFLPGFATAQYPHNGDFLMLATVLPWHDVAFARVPALVYLALTALAVYALAVELGATRAASVTFSAIALAVPSFLRPALDGLPDDVTVGLLATGCLFLVRHWRTSRRGELALAGLAMGLGFGGEWFGLTAGAVVVAVWLGGRIVARRVRPSLVRDTGHLLGMMALGGGFWLVRNLIESGNPIYPKTVSLAGLRLFQGSRGDVIDRFGYAITDYISKPHILREYIYPGFKSQLGIAGLVLLAGLAAALASARWRHDRGSRYLLAAVLVVAGIFLVYTITPGTAYRPEFSRRGVRHAALADTGCGSRRGGRSGRTPSIRQVERRARAGGSRRAAGRDSSQPVGAHCPGARGRPGARSARRDRLVRSIERHAPVVGVSRPSADGGSLPAGGTDRLGSHRPGADR